MKRLNEAWLPLLVCFAPMLANQQVEQGGGSFRVQWPPATLRHSGSTKTGGTGTVVNPTGESAEAPYAGPVTRTATQDPGGTHSFVNPSTHRGLTLVDNGGAINCLEISDGEGYRTESDLSQTFMFAFGPLSGLNAIENGQPGAQFPIHFSNPYCEPASPNGANYHSGQANPHCSGTTPTDRNGAVGDVRPPITKFRRSDASVVTAESVYRTREEERYV